MAEQERTRGPAALFAVGAIVIAATVWATQERATQDLHERMGAPLSTAVAPSAAAPPVAPPSPEPAWLVERRAGAEAALATDPDDLDALNTLTQIWLADPSQAMAYNARAIEVDPDDPDARTLQAALASMVGMHDRALERLDAILAEHPDHPRALTYKGLVSIEAGRPEDAIAALERVIALTGEDPGLRAAVEHARLAAAER